MSELIGTRTCGKRARTETVNHSMKNWCWSTFSPPASLPHHHFYFTSLPLLSHFIFFLTWWVNAYVWPRSGQVRKTNDREATSRSYSDIEKGSPHRTAGFWEMIRSPSGMLIRWCFLGVYRVEELRAVALCYNIHHSSKRSAPRWLQRMYMWSRRAQVKEALMILCDMISNVCMVMIGLSSLERLRC